MAPPQTWRSKIRYPFQPPTGQEPWVPGPCSARLEQNDLSPSLFHKDLICRQLLCWMCRTISVVPVPARFFRVFCPQCSAQGFQGSANVGFGRSVFPIFINLPSWQWLFGPNDTIALSSPQKSCGPKCLVLPRQPSPVALRRPP